MSFYAWGDYVSVGEKRRQAQQSLPSSGSRDNPLHP